MALQHAKPLANSLADREIARLIFLERMWRAADQRPGLALCKAHLEADASYFFGGEKVFDFDFEGRKRSVGNVHVLAGMNALAGFVAVPSRHIDRGRLPLVGKGHGPRAAHHW